ncbi:hypothetical protein [Microbacterium sp. 10M-3C3]|uniref:hypothetical protein n=1 Tax=Microbacterium sp. 10M-3C3 TaxID=2483401 RepID=UPI000F6311DF|nr:hypothetical protein [Microbacterium sp. 10M-3C3]
MSPERVPDKRPAFEPPVALVAPTHAPADMPRPASIVAGSALVLLRAAAGALWVLSAVLGWTELADAASLFNGGPTGDSGVRGAPTVSVEGDLDTSVLLAIVWAIVGAGVVFEAVLGVLILRGRNIPRVLVLVFSTASIVSAFVGWWSAGQEIRIETTYITIALDILILLALSSRSAAAYARRERTVSRPTSGRG